MRHQECNDEAQLVGDSGQPILDVEKISSVVLSRLIEEVRTEKLEHTTAYNRTHNRHNRGR